MDGSLSNRTRLGRIGIVSIPKGVGLPRTGGRERMKEPFHGMKMYAKNQEVAACLPAAEELKHFRLRGEGNIRHPEKPKRRQRRRNCTWIYLFRLCCVPFFLLSFPSTLPIRNRRKIARRCGMR